MKNFVAIDTEDKHVLQNKICETRGEAETLAKRYEQECVSFVSNSYGVVELSSLSDLHYGDFPYDSLLYYEPNSPKTDNVKRFDGYVHIAEEDRKKFPKPRIMTEEEYLREEIDSLKAKIKELEEKLEPGEGKRRD